MINNGKTQAIKRGESGAVGATKDGNKSQELQNGFSLRHFGGGASHLPAFTSQCKLLPLLIAPAAAGVLSSLRLQITPSPSLRLQIASPTTTGVQV